MKRTAALLTCLALLIPGAAVASASPTTTPCSYTHTCKLSKVDHASASRTPNKGSKTQRPTSPASVQATNATRTTSTGSLPFTGLDIGALAAGAVVLLGAGLVLRRASATNRS